MTVSVNRVLENMDMIREYCNYSQDKSFVISDTIQL